jgi:ribulose-5-phosphate 4-epimerase/fuculose-1-phosphate aldolase
MASPGRDGLALQLAAASRILVQRGILGYSGHLSVRGPEPGTFLVQPGDDGRGALEPGRILTLDLDGRVLEGEARPPIELYIHSEVYRARPDVAAVAHFHHDPTTLLSLVEGLDFVPLKNHSSRWAPEVPVHPDVTHIRTPEQGRALAATLGGRHAALLRAHGEVLLAEDVAHVLADAVHFVENAELLVRAAGLGRPLRPLTDEEVAAFRDSFSRSRHARKLWSYYVGEAARAGVIPGSWQHDLLPGPGDRPAPQA